MSNWRKLNEEWINLDFIKRFYISDFIEPSSQQCQYYIRLEWSDGCEADLFEQCFKTSKKAEKFLDNFIEKIKQE